MKNYKDYIISKGGKEIGLTAYDIKRYLMTPDEYIRFEKYMKNQTVSMIEGLNGHIEIIYTGDYERFIKGLPNND